MISRDPCDRDPSSLARDHEGSREITRDHKRSQGITRDHTVHLTRCLRTLRARLQSTSAAAGTSGGRARRARRALVRVNHTAPTTLWGGHCAASLDRGGGPGAVFMLDVVVVGRFLYFSKPFMGLTLTMRAWPVARSIFDAPLCERSERADNKLDKAHP